MSIMMSVFEEALFEAHFTWLASFSIVTYS